MSTYPQSDTTTKKAVVSDGGAESPCQQTMPKLAALQEVILTSANFSSIATDEKA